MAHFLRLGLLVSGVLSAVVLAAPSLVMLGLFLLILPGLVLGAMPSVFFYLCLFSVVWFSLERRGGAVASVLAGGGVLLFGLGLPMLLNPITDARLVEAASRNLRAQGKVGPVKWIALEFPKGSYHQTDCDELCLMLLYNHAAEGVLMRSTEGKPAVAYRIVTGRCAVSEKILKSLERSWGSSWSPSLSREKVSQAVRMRIAGEECLEEVLGFGGSPELTVRWVEDTVGVKPGNWSLLPGEVARKGVEVLRGDTVLGRETMSRASRIALPLFLEPYGGGLDFVGWRWSRKLDAADESKLDRLAMLKRLTGFELDVPRGMDESLIRKSLDRALEDASGPGGAFALLGDYSGLLQREGMESGDTERFVKLVSDDRVKEFHLIEWRAFGKQGVPGRVRDALLKRIGRLAEAGDLKTLGEATEAAARLPKGSYRGEVPELYALLRQAKGRELFRSLIPRLSEQGSAGAAQMVSIVEEGWGNREGRRHWEWEVEAALNGLCKAGDAARPLLPRLMQLQQKYAADHVTRSYQWMSLLVGLGADAGQFRSSVERDPQKFRAELERMARACRLD